MEHRDLLDRLGSNRYIAFGLGVDHTTVSRWRAQGIPPHMWVPVARFARRNGVRLTAEDLARTAPEASKGRLAGVS